MKKLAVLLSYFILQASSILHAGWVAETQDELYTQGDWNADGQPDLLLLDRATGVLRVALWTNGGALSWQEPIPTGVEGATSIAFGQFLIQSQTRPGLAITSPSLNRVQVVAPQVAEPQILSAPGVGPNSLVTLADGPAAVSGGMLIASTMNDGVSPWSLAQFGTADLVATNALLERGNEITAGYHGFMARATEVDGSDSFRLHQGGLVAWKTLAGVPAASDWTAGQFTATASRREYLFWQRGQTTLRMHSFDTVPGPPSFSAASNFTLPQAIAQVAVLTGTTPPRLLVIFDGGTTAGVYDFDGVNAPVLARTLTPEPGQTFRSALAWSAGDFHLFAGTAGSLSSTSAQRYRRQSDGSYLADAASTIPAIGQGSRRANLLLYSGEPFVDENARLVSALTTRDWTTAATGIPGLIQATAEIFQSSTAGLGQPANVSLGASSYAPTHSLPSQYADDVSISVFSAPTGFVGPELRLSPPPGRYASELNVTINATGLTPGVQVRYRTATNEAWQNYDAAARPPIAITGTTLLQAYAVSGGSAVSPVVGGLYSIGTGNSPAFPITLAATSITHNSAVLNATVDPNGSATTAAFDYGTSTSLGLSTIGQALGSGDSAVPLNATITGLLPHKTYYFRVKATSAEGTNLGKRLSFTTANREPVFADAAFNGTEDTPLSATLSATDPDSDALTFTKLSDPAHGTVSVSLGGGINYVPEANFNGSDSFTAKAADAYGGEATATITLSIAPVNDVPVALSESVDGALNTPVIVTLTATDVENDPLTWEVTTPPSNGTLTGTAPYLEYQPNPNFTGTDSLTFRVKDGGAIYSAPATITINVFNQPLAGNGLTFLATSAARFDPTQGALTPAFDPDIANYTQSTTDDHLTCWPIRLEPGSTVQARINGGTYTTVYHKPAVWTSRSQSLAIRAGDGAVIAWGGLGQDSVPTGLTDIQAVSAGRGHSLALKADGTVVAWGDDRFDQAKVPPGLGPIFRLDANDFHSFALDGNGQVIGWGLNTGGQGTTGIPGNPSDGLLFPPPPNLTDVVDIASGHNHVLALKRDGTVVGWGKNGYAMKDVPPGLNKVVAIAASEWTSMALKRDGTVVTWGENVGQFDIVPGYEEIKNIVAIAAGERQTFALRNDGVMLQWGQDGILLPHKYLPGFFGGNIVGLTAGYNTYTAQLEDGTLVGWGLNVNGAAEPPSDLRVSRSTATPRMPLNPGLNRIEFKVSSPDRDYVRTYSIAVNRLVAGPPTVSALTGVQVLSNTATVSALVNPGGRNAATRLLYSTDQSFNLNSFYVDVPAGYLPVTVNHTINGLQPGTTYYCMMRVATPLGTVYSPVFQFTTELPQIPTISSLGTQTILKHGISPWLDFTVGPGPYANQLTVTAASDNPTLLPVSGIEFDSAATGAVRRLRLKPVCGLTGTAVVTLTATLSGSTVTTNFTVNVVERPPADPAQITGLGFLPSFGFGTLDSKALEISGDGNVVAGRSTGRTFRWTASGGMEDLYFNGAGPDTNRITLTGISYDGAVLGGYLDSFFVGMGQDATAFLLNSGSNYYQALPDSFQLNGLSGDGSVGVGHLNDSISHLTPDQPVRWTETNGIEYLGKAGSLPVSATNISSDGSTIVGYYGDYYPGFFFGASSYACYWPDAFSAPSVLRTLDPLPGGQHCRANAVSADGSVIVGYSDSAAQPGVPKAVRWVREGFTWQNIYIVHELDSSLSSIATVATAVSADGSRIVGTVGGGFLGGGTAFVWDAENGQQVLQTALVHGGANVNAGWSSLDEATGISADGLYIVGTGTRTDFITHEAFRAELPQIPPTPIIAPIANVTTPSGVPVVVPFTLSDPDSNVNCLAVSYDLSNPTLLPAANVVLGGSGANRTIRLTPAAGQSGMALIVLSVTDGFSTSEQEIVFTVPSPDSLDGWRFQHFGSASSTGGGALTADPDGDGHTNLEEFAFGTNPGGSSQGCIEVINGIITKHGSPIPLATNTPTSVEFSAVFGRLANWQSLGLIYKVRFSADMMTWEESTVTPTVLATDGNLEAVSIPYPSSIISGGQVVKPQFFEVVISIPP